MGVEGKFGVHLGIQTHVSRKHRVGDGERDGKSRVEHERWSGARWGGRQ